MRHLNYFTALYFAFLICAFSQVPAFAQAGFNCAKASTLTEKAICSDPEIAEADRAMSISYKALVERADPRLKEALRSDQNSFIQLRAEAYENHTSTVENRVQRLLDDTEMRAEFLNWISVSDNASLEGNWRNTWGVIEVEKDKSGGLAVKINVADQANGSWLCSFEGVLEQNSASEAKFQGEGGPLVIRLNGAALSIPTPFCDESTSGGFGNAAGTYFRVGAQ